MKAQRVRARCQLKAFLAEPGLDKHAQCSYIIPDITQAGTERRNKGEEELEEKPLG